MRLAAAVLSLALMGATPALARPAPLAGVWVTQSGNVAVRLIPCGAALCGDVVRVMANRSMADSRVALPAPPRVGLRILSDLRPAGDAWRGHIFNRENGRTYDCLVRPTGDGRLEVRAFVLLPLFGQTQLWQRDPAP
jgi:uncharacterized protein (DUF2147 family)